MTVKASAAVPPPNDVVRGALYDVIIVGGGTAGLSAALVLGRARRKVLVCDNGRPRNAAAEQMHGFISRDGMPPAKFLEIARAELRRYPSVELINSTVSLAKRIQNGFSVDLESGETFSGKRLLLANGVRDTFPPIENIADFWGRGVFVCPFCDGWEFRDRKIAVYGKGREAVDLAQELYGWTKEVAICSQSEPNTLTAKQRRWIDATACKFFEGPIKRLVGDTNGVLVALELEDGKRVACDALFIPAPLRQCCSIAQRLGCKVDRSQAIVVDKKSQTRVRGCYAAGDAVTTVHQVILAASSGARAAIAISTDLLCAEADLIARRRNGRRPA
ncbi:MAG TPA: NAD(P)/FAD-dependent oxidoreductase [Candidatus Eremiobacteraceae bacterium]|nr:NAD(P)/FAD-dependent oxidoreductase [Candidatus Eremiobacteraceae bacterium]